MLITRKRTKYYTFCSDFIVRICTQSIPCAILSSGFALRSLFVPILSSEWGIYNTAIKLRAESNLFELCRGGAVKRLQRRINARAK